MTSCRVLYRLPDIFGRQSLPPPWILDYLLFSNGDASTTVRKSPVPSDSEPLVDLDGFCRQYGFPLASPTEKHATQLVQSVLSNVSKHLELPTTVPEEKEEAEERKTPSPKQRKEVTSLPTPPPSPVAKEAPAPRHERQHVPYDLNWSIHALIVHFHREVYVICWRTPRQQAYTMIGKTFRIQCQRLVCVFQRVLYDTFPFIELVPACSGFRDQQKQFAKKLLVQGGENRQYLFDPTGTAIGDKILLSQVRGNVFRTSAFYPVPVSGEKEMKKVLSGQVNDAIRKEELRLVRAWQKDWDDRQGY